MICLERGLKLERGLRPLSLTHSLREKSPLIPLFQRGKLKAGLFKKGGGVVYNDNEKQPGKNRHQRTKEAR